MDREHSGMLGEVDMGESGNEGGDETGSPRGMCGMQMHSDPPQEPLLLLLEVTQMNGRPLPVGMFTVHAVAQCVIDLTGQNPVEVDIMNDRDAVVQMEPKNLVVHVAQALHNARIWDGQTVEITCLLSSRQSLINVVHEQDHARQRMQRLEAKAQRFQQEQQENQEQMVELLQKFGTEVKKVEELHRRVEQAEVIPKRTPLTPAKGEIENTKEEITNTPVKMESTTTMSSIRETRETKIAKPPQVCTFSGQDPVPKEEGNYDQWEFQVRGAIATHTENSVRTAIVNSLRGPARDLVGFVGFDAPLEKILAEVTNRFGKWYTGDKLQQEFYMLSQEKGEKIGTFAGRLELAYRWLHDRLPERFNERQLKDHLFYDVSQSLHDSSWYLYKDPTVTYQALLKALEETESEYIEGKASIRAKATAVMDKNSIAELKDKIEVLTTVVKSGNVVNARTKPPGSLKPKSGNRYLQKNGAVSTNSPMKGKGPATSAAGPFKMGQKPIQCYNCGGWGHGWRNCTTKGNMDWRSLNRAEPPPEGTAPAPTPNPKTS